MPYTIRIPTTGVSSDSKPYTIYNILLDTPLRTQTLQKRYSDFTTLQTDLTKAAGSAPPATLPGKSWFSRTINNPELTEERRKGLEAYLQAIEKSPDSKWRNSAPYKSFLGFSASAAPGEGRRKSAIEEEALGPAVKPTMSSQQWLDLHNDLKSYIQSARLALSKRDQVSSVTLQHEAGAQAKKWLVKAHTLILRLEDGLRGLSESKQGGERLGDGEVRRRRDLLGRARKEREGLEGVLNTVATRSNAGRASPDYGKGRRNDADSESVNSGAGIPGSFPIANKPGGRRVLGGPPAKETERTRELDNAGVLQLQQQIMKEQDMDVADLTAVVKRMKEMGYAINEELIDQGQLLDVLDQDVDRVEGKIGIAKNRIKKIR